MDRYIRQIYGGNPPSMGHYYQLGATKRRNEEARKAAEKQRREAEKAAEQYQKDVEKAIERARKQQEKKREEEALNNLLAELSPRPQAPQPQTQTQTATPSRSRQAIAAAPTPTPPSNNKGGFFGRLRRSLDDVIEGGRAFGQAINPFDDVSYSQALENYINRDRPQEAQNVARGMHRTVDSMTMGAMGGLDKRINDREPFYRDDRAFGEGGGTDMIHDLAGSLVPGAGIASAMRAAGIGANVTRGMNVGQRALQRGREGAIAGALYGGSEAAINEALDPERRDFMDHLTNIGLETAFGAVADPALGELFDLAGRGIGRGLGITGRNTPNVELPTPSREPVQAPQRPIEARNVFADPIIPEVELPTQYRSVETPTPELDFRINQNENFRFDPPEVRQQRTEEITTQRQQIEAQLEQSREEFIDEILDSYGVDRTPERQLIEADMEWENIKNARQEYQELRQRIEKFTIPQELQEELGHIVPRSLVDRNSSLDIYRAAEMAGFDGDAQGAAEFAQYLRTLQEATTTRKMDVTPEIDPRALEELEAAKQMAETLFQDSDDYRALQSMLDAFDADIQSLQNPTNMADAFDVNVTPIQPDTPATNPLDDIMNLRRPDADADADAQIAASVDPNAPNNAPVGETIDWGNRHLDETDTVMGPINRFLEQFSDKGRAVKVIERQIQKAVGKLTQRYKNAYRDYRLVPGATGAGEHFLTKNLLEPMRELEANGLDLRQAWEYVTNLQLRRVKELRPEYVLPGKNNTLDNVNNVIDTLGQDPNVREFAQIIQRTQRNVLDMLEDAGVISKKMKEELIEQYPDYVPLFRAKGTTTTDDFLNIFTTGNVRKVIHELQSGSETPIADPLGNFVDYVMNAHQASFTNRALQHISSLKDVKINGKTLAVDVTANPDAGDKRFQITFKQNGQDKTFQLTPDLYIAYNNLKSVIEPNKFIRFVNGVAKVQRQSITANPIFTIRQLVRDIPEAYVNGNFSLIRDLLPAALDMISNGRLTNSQLENFYKHGAGYGNIVSMDRTSNHALKRAAKKIRGNDNIKDVAEGAYEATIGRVLNTLRVFNESLENLPRLAQFRATERRTGDLDQAAFDARDLMDFSMSGSTTEKINRMAAFVNANIRGKEKFARSLKDRPLETMGKAVVVGGGMSTLAYMAYENMASPKQKEIMETVPEWMRQTYWLFPAENGEDIIRIPKPYEVSVITSTPIEFALWNEHLVGSDIKDYLKAWATETFLIDMSLNPVTPIYEAAADHDLFRNTSITSGRETHLEPGTEGDVYTPFTAEMLGQATGVNPRRFEHLMRGYMPTTSENANVLIDRIAEMTGLRENQRPAGTAGGPDRFYNPFVMPGANFQSDRIGDIYEAADEVQALKKRTQQEDGELFQFPNAYQAVNRLKSEDQDLASMIRTIDNDPNLDRYEKQQLREEIIARRNEFANRQVESGRTDVSEEGLAALESEFAGLGATTTKADVKAVLATQLQERGIPRHVIDQVMSMELTNEQMANALRRLLNAN